MQEPQAMEVTTNRPQELQPCQAARLGKGHFPMLGFHAHAVDIQAGTQQLILDSNEGEGGMWELL